MPRWADLPPDVLTCIVRSTGDNPFTFARVCKGWAWLLDEPEFRASLHVQYWPNARYTLQEVLRSFGQFVCSRTPATHVLEVTLRTRSSFDKHYDFNAATAACASLAPALVHLAPTLRRLQLSSAFLADVFVTSPFIGLSQCLQHVRSNINYSVDLSKLANLRSVDLAFDGAAVEYAHLPRQLESARFTVHGSAPQLVLTSVLDQLGGMPLHTLALSTAHECSLDVAALKPTMQSLVVGGARVQLDLCGASLPALHLLSLHNCAIQSADFAPFVRSCTALHTLRLMDYHVEDHPQPFCDIRGLRLHIFHIRSDRYRARLLFAFPAGINTATLSYEDLMDAFAQPAFTTTLESLALDLQGADVHMLDLAWPAALPLPRLRSVTATDVGCSRLAAALGQRCAGAQLDLPYDWLPDVDM